MKERIPLQFGNLGDLAAILAAFICGAATLYLIFRMIFGASIFGTAIQAEIDANRPLPPTQNQVHTGPGEVVGIIPQKTKPLALNPFGRPKIGPTPGWWAVSCRLAQMQGKPAFSGDRPISRPSQTTDYRCVVAARSPRERVFVPGGFLIFTQVSHLEPILEPVIEAAGFRLVRLRMMGGMHKTLQVMAERGDGTMNVEDCAVLSRALLAFFEAQDPIEGEYELEVSSPGIDRPLTRLTDFSRWAGHAAKIELHAPLDGRRRFRGTLRGLNGNDVTVTVEGGTLTFPFRSIAEAKLVLTEKLIQDDLRAKAKANA